MKQKIKKRIEQINNGIVPDGYQKNNYIGLAPKSWKLGKINDVVDNIRRPIPKPKTPYWRLGIKSWAKGTFHAYVDEPDKVNMDELYIVYNNDLIVNITFAWEHAIAIANKNDDGLLVSHRFPTYEFKEFAVPNYYKYVVMQKHFKYMLEMISPGGAGRNRVLNKKDFLSLPIYIPSYKEQEKIAEILETQDRIIEIKEKILKSKEQQLKYFIQNLSLGNKGIFGSKGKWESKKLYSILTERSEKNSDTSKTICSVSVKKGVVSQYQHLGKNMAAEDTSNYKIVKYGDIVYTKSPTGKFPFGIVKQSFLNEEVAVSPLYAVYEPISIDIGYLLHIYFLNESNAEKYLYPIVNIGAKHTMNISNDTFISKSILFPSDEQEISKLANLFRILIKEIEILEMNINEEQKKKKALMQLLLTGIVRV